MEVQSPSCSHVADSLDERAPYKHDLNDISGRARAGVEIEFCSVRMMSDSGTDKGNTGVAAGAAAATKSSLRCGGQEGRGRTRRIWVCVFFFRVCVRFFFAFPLARLRSCQGMR